MRLLCAGPIQRSKGDGNPHTRSPKKNALGDSHPETLYTMSSLAMSYSKLNRHGEEEELCSRALDLQNEILGERHPDTIQSMRYLAEIYYRQG
jgi:hypothetical protein